MNESRPSAPVESPALREARSLKEGSDSPEELRSNWEKMKPAITAALKAGGEQEKAAMQLIKEILAELEDSPSSPLKTELETLVKTEVAAFCSQLKSMSPADQKNYLLNNLEGVEALNEKQENCMSTLTITSEYLQSLLHYAMKNGGAETHTVRYLKTALDSFQKAYKAIPSNPNPDLKTLIPAKVLDSLQYPKYFFTDVPLPSLSPLKPIDLRAPMNPAQQTQLKLLVIDNMRVLKDYASISVLGAQFLGNDLEKSKQAVKPQVETKLSQLWHETYMTIFSDLKAKGLISKTPPTEIEAQAKAATELLRPLIESQLALKHLANSGTKLTGDSQVILAKLTGIYDFKDEWTTLSDEGADHLSTIAIELAYLACCIAIPELVASKTLQTLGRLSQGALKVLSTSKNANRMAKTMLTVGSMGLETGNLALGLYGGNALRILMSSTISEGTAFAVDVLWQKKELKDALETPWIFNILMNGVVSGVFDAPGIASRSIPESLEATLVSGMASRSAILLVKTLFTEVSKTSAAFFLASSLKEGKFTGSLNPLIDAMGPELYELTQA